ncbi:Na(+)/H(+) antiporter subunit C [Corynebacterium minutissimum]|uniref:Na(+)/H(+) antiporter subunit C n=1 Tax=unclassified Corynebacterium TaxID=2624378 RepID=UPI0008A3EC75|nr:MULTISPECIES: Na(+)/H(+) antiporter subunit C [unclassified Corynebacterium]MDK8763675.1 Na(+)/H(+) antiporter subunit C [Corynebacterium sp. MSK218]OFR69118.1 cation:proton antiporter [Corynebacterium sp. HMSC078H07]
MDANLMLLLAAGVLCGAGVYLLLDRAMTKMLLGILLLGNGANLFMLMAGGQAGSPPIDGRTSRPYGEQIADPLAQGMILTAIVISMALTGFILTLAYRQYRYRSADVIEDDTEDTAIAAMASRPGNASAAPDHDASNDPATGRATKEGDKFGPQVFEEPVKEANDD